VELKKEPAEPSGGHVQNCSALQRVLAVMPGTTQETCNGGHWQIYLELLNREDLNGHALSGGKFFVDICRNLRSNPASAWYH
jgi:hypothetical protein